VKSGDKNKPAVIMAHGYSGHSYEYPFKNFAKVTEKDFCTYRINFYDGQEGGRRAIDCTLQTHADDLTTVIEWIKLNHNKIFTIGHSFGGPSVMLANHKDIKAASLWDPSYNIAQSYIDFASSYEKHQNFYVLTWGDSYLMGKPMYEFGSKLNAEFCENLAKHACFPVQVILAGTGYFVNKGNSYDSFGHPKNRRDIIAEAGHCFFENDTATEAATLTANWFKQWL
jgi:dienelactone hydrolase